METPVVRSGVVPVPPGTGEIAFGTKAETLARLAPRLSRSYVKPLVAFTVARWRESPQAVLGEVAARLPFPALVVRSSARGEDTAAASNAGAYESVLDVPGGDPDAIARAVEAVVASYDGTPSDDQVLVQEQLVGARMSGVLFTRDPGTLAPYYVFNYDDTGGATDSVTSGRGGGLKTFVRFRRTTERPPGSDLGAVLAAVEEVEALFESDRLDIELAVDVDARVCIFQVRPIVSRAGPPPPDEVVADYLGKVRKKVEKLSRRHPHLHGDRTVFGVMPDWNPAEMIGLRPRALALSLYKELITDAIWAYQRDGYGYKNLRSFPLLVSFLGVPFIDVRVDFNSFVPGGLRERLSDRLVNYYVTRLVEGPHLHDKVEFDIVFSCYYPGIREQTARLTDAGFTGIEVGEILAELRLLTHRVIHPATGLYRKDLARIEELQLRRRRVLDSGMSTVDKVYWLVEDCKRYGTLPFSGLARAAFMAVQFLRAFVALGVLTPEDYRAFLASLHTVAQQMTRDLALLARGERTREVFLERYGHLRPGTYDILSPRYDEAMDRYFGNLEAGPVPPGPPGFHLSAAQGRAMATVLEAEGLDITPDSMLEFCRVAIEGRESSKLVFTRSLSDALVLIEALGRQCGLSRDDVSHLSIRTVLGLYSSLDALDLRDVLLRDVEANRRAHVVTGAVRLPHLIVDPGDVFQFHLFEGQPNYIGSGRAMAEVVREAEFGTSELRGRIVCVASADPGYDWLFSKGIGGLVTMFGGANSHMAIRAAELQIPAVIGCGEVHFQAWSRASCLEIDCANRRVAVVR